MHLPSAQGRDNLVMQLENLRLKTTWKYSRQVSQSSAIPRLRNGKGS